jgi:hypothetical protein
MGKIRDFLSFPPVIFFSLILIGAVVVFGYASVVGEQAEEEPPHVTPVVELEDKVVKKPAEITVTLKVLAGHGDGGHDHRADEEESSNEGHDEVKSVDEDADHKDQADERGHITGQNVDEHLDEEDHKDSEDHSDAEDHEEEVDFGGLYAKIVVYSPQGGIYTEKVGTTDEEGMVSFTFLIDENTPLGRYSVLPLLGKDESLLVIGDAAFLEVT